MILVYHVFSIEKMIKGLWSFVARNPVSSVKIMSSLMAIGTVVEECNDSSLLCVFVRQRDFMIRRPSS